MALPCPARVRARVPLFLLLALLASAVVTLLPAPPAHAGSFAHAVLSEAARHEGKPYRYGATGPDSFDCSGFTGYVYRQLGVELPRTSRDQYAALPKVSPADKRPGDLIFTYNSGGIYHVGIYAGDNRMWAAPRTGEHVRLQTIWTSSYKVARPVSGEIQRHWVSFGGRDSFLGSPRSGEVRTPDGSGAYTHYQGGSIYWSHRTAAREVHGEIRSTWSELGWERSALGYPVTDERRTPDGRGAYNHFAHGSIYWSPGTGAREVRGAIRDVWSRLGWERSALGYPVTDELATPGGRGRYNHFERGSVFWTPTTGAREVRGAIRDHWASMGWERSWLGYPTSDEQATATGARSDFEGGYIVWDAATGKTTAVRH